MSRPERSSQAATPASERRLNCLERLQPGLAHDLKGPLNALSLNLTLLKRASQGGVATETLRERQHQWVETMETELARLRRQMELVLTLLESDATTDDERPGLDLARLVEDLRLLLAAQARRRAVTLELPQDAAAAALAAAHGSAQARPGAVRRALVELISRLVETVEEGGTVRMGCRAESGQLVLEILAAPWATDGTVGSDGSGSDGSIVQAELETIAGVFRREGGEFETFPERNEEAIYLEGHLLLSQRER